MAAHDPERTFSEFAGGLASPLSLDRREGPRSALTAEESISTVTGGPPAATGAW